MKTLSVLVLSLLLLWGCKEEKPDRYFSSSPEIDQTKALIGDYEKGDWKAMQAHYADTAKIYHNSTRAISASDFVKSFQEGTAGYQSYGFQDNDQYYEMIIDDKDERWVNFWGNWEATFKEKDTSLVVPVHVTLEFKDGKVVEEHAYYDTAGLIRIMNKIAADKAAAEEMNN
ncbi:nuclear transport factor 2 family protein [Zeaxanthinibacter enoshimensis]|uniref:SnoaL-like protein n=1 Tax=Zeaxanthinibacter enoshimensis TaxID=392009 RepID=A0A4R6TKL8_9FLAO|nr:nuclear transport factor 2 family protein [Zeaxanthinibacter enoshimensis]TDQ29392.1 SnoaL-like protein [Zeaxanthinibacter enoshimensis]